ncbi:MAG: hypothetical protein JXR64_13115 [Spirochaetales bacterium]|nr:hypothetical protein [Spirochaetales bacterium]
MQSKEHGIYKIELTDNILLTDAIGPFNRELIEHYNRDLKSTIESITSPVWGQIIILHSMSMFTPEAELEFRKTMEYRKNKGLRVIGLVTTDCESSMLVQWQFSKVYSDFGIIHNFVNSYEDAKLFVSSELNKININS